MSTHAVTSVQSHICGVLYARTAELLTPKPRVRLALAVASAEPSAWRQKKKHRGRWLRLERGPPAPTEHAKKSVYSGIGTKVHEGVALPGPGGLFPRPPPSLAGTPHSLRMLCDPAPLMACCAHRIRVGPARQQKGYCCCRVQLKVGRRRETASFPLLLCGRRLFPLQIFTSPVACACLGYASARF